MELNMTFAALVAAGLIAASLPALAQDPDGQGVPWCDAEDGTADRSDCALLAGDLIVHVAYQRDTYSLVQFFNDGEPVSRDEGLYYGDAGSAPLLHDLNGDDVKELIVPVESYAANADYDIWSINDVGFTRKGRLTTSWWPTNLGSSDGYFLAGEKLSAWEYNETAYSLTSHGLNSVYTLNTNFQNEAGSYCSLDVAVDTLGPYGLEEDTLLAVCEQDAAKALE